MADLVEMFHDGLDTIMLCPRAATQHYEERGWVRVDELEPMIPVVGEDGEIDWEDSSIQLSSPRQRDNSPVEADDAEAENKTSTQEDD